MAGRTASTRRSRRYYNNADSMRQMYVYGNAVEKPAYEPKTSVKKTRKEKNICLRLRRPRGQNQN